MTTEPERINQNIFSSSVMTQPAPKFKFPQTGKGAREVYQLVHDELFLDGVSRMNMATFCTTWMEDEAKELMAESIDKNIVDKDEYPQTAEIETRCVHLLADLLHSPEATTTTGTSTTGSSEAAMLGGLAAKWNWKKRRMAEGKDYSKPNFVCGPVQVCWEKFARYFDIEIRQAPMPAGYLLTPEMAVELCDENTIMVVPTFGQTFTGLFEDVKGISEALDDLQKRTGLDIPLHVDAASGGFVAAFCAPDLLWDFRLPRVKSINMSGHKTGLAPLGSGWVIWREKEDLPQELIFNVNYLGGEMPTFSLNFSRPGGQVITSYYNFLRLGRDGYTEVQSACYAAAQHIAAGIKALGRFDIIFNGDPSRGIPTVSWQMSAGKHSHDLYDFAEELRIRGWLVPAYSLPANQQDQVVQRAVIRHGFSMDMADLLLEDMRRVIDKLDRQHTGNATGGQASFNHHAVPAVKELGAANGHKKR